MKLISAHVTNFRSAENTGKFSLDQVACLVGKNESGKSAVLQALASLNPHPSTPMSLDKERDYPRRYLTAYSDRHPGTEAVAVTTEWQLEQSELEAVAAELGEGVLTSPVVKVSRRYNTKDPELDIKIDLKRAMKNALAGGGFDDNQLAELISAKDTVGLIGKLSALPTPTPAQQQALGKIKGYGTLTNAAVAILRKTLPFFMYFSNYDRMEGAVQFEQLQQLKANNQLQHEDYSGARLFLEFMEFAGVPLEEILNVNTYETFNAKLQGASNNITDQILEYWTQNPDLEVRVNVTPGKTGDKPPFNNGTVGRARIYNQLHRVDTPFSERSAGFVWFFSFLVKFARVKSDGKPVVLLLDEPGLTLHGKAQGDLLRYFDEKLAPHHQVVYSTHSPFMVAPDKLTSARIVEDVVDASGPRRVSHGTKVREDVLSNDPDTLFPLQGALGYEITQTLFIGKHTLLVEGPSDIVYLQALSAALKSRGRAGLDSRWTICPTGGIGNVRAFVSLFGGNKLDVTVLTDQTKKDKNKIEELKRAEVLKAGRVLTIAQFTGKDESDIEDLFEPSVFVALVNAAYALPDAQKLTPQSLNAADADTPRLVKKAEAAFKLMPESTPMYDHFTPAAWLLSNPTMLGETAEDIKATLDRAEPLFQALNALLPKS